MNAIMPPVLEMTPLTTITGLTAEAAELLSSIGIRSTFQLAGEEPATLHSRLEVIAWQRGRTSMAPQLEQIEHWIAIARMLTPPDEIHAISVDDIPEAVTGAAGGQAWMPPSLRAAQQAGGAVRTETDSESARQKSAAPDNQWRKVDPAHFATIDAYNEGRIGVQPLSRDSIHDVPEVRSAENEGEADDEEDSPRRVQRLRSNGEDLSPWIRRGVVHPRGFHTWLGALVSLLWRIAIVSGVFGFIYFVFKVEDQSAYTREVIGGFVILLILGFMQLHFAGRSRCRICSCNLFHSKNCLKNRKAHHIPGLGYVASLSLHLLLFGWFRCMYCGTAIRLKPGAARKAGGG